MNLLKVLARKILKKYGPETRYPIYRRASGVYVNDDTAMQVSAYYRGVIYIATQIAKLPWEVKDKDKKKLENHPINKLLNVAPNNEMSAFNFRLLMVQQAINHGNAYAEIERTRDGRPVAIWPLCSYDVTPIRTPDGKFVYRVAAGSLARPGENIYLDPKDVFHIKNFHTKDGLTGLSLVEYAHQTIGNTKSADIMAGGIFENGGIPSGVIQHPGKMSDEAFERLQTSWKEEHGGRKSGGTAILEDGAKYEAIEVDAQVLQFLESRQFGVIEIARFLGIPPTKLFDMAHSTFSNVENANLEVATDTLDAWARNIENETDIKLLGNSYGGIHNQLDLYAVFRGDMKTRSDYFSKMMQTGAITPNQIREREGLPGYDGGDRYFIAVNNFTPADRLDEVIDSQVKQKEQPKPEDDPVEKAVLDLLKN